jgi:hypothetical protein
MPFVMSAFQKRATAAMLRAATPATDCPDEIEVMKAAYESALIDVGVTDRDDPITDLIAKAVVNITASGESDPKEVMERALNALGVRRSAA